jgi:hypothetical protein
LPTRSTEFRKALVLRVGGGDSRLRGTYFFLQ